MPRIYVYFALLLLLVGAIATRAVADDPCCGPDSGLGFSGSVGLEVTFTPIPPLSYNIESGLTLSVSVAGFTLASETVFDLSGFESQGISVDVILGAVQIGDDILFDPYFSWNDLSIAAQIVGIGIGTDLILADIGSVQTPEYTMAAVLRLSSGINCGFSITTLTGFGAVDLVNMLGGITAPFSHDLLDLFYHTQFLFASAPSTKVTVVSGFYFEEELVRLQMDYMGLLSSSTTWFNWTGFAQEVLEIGYRFEEPSLALLAAIAIDDSFSVSDLDFILDLQIDPVRFTSRTSFAATVPPATLPIAFSGQGFALSFALCDQVTVGSITLFDATFMFAEQDLVIEATIDPVSLTSLTTFDATGFSGQWIEARVTFSGVSLYTQAAFDFSGINSVSFGFELTF
ncbi:hypothetical protein J7K60_02360 [Candidatus Bipolaricaulota bacterium]|nr:hypothetical protein [Candidatus Bipolaricaulota bacterium]HHR86038.1 hypothetical protein [Candidatus Acetothermia bacterium]